LGHETTNSDELDRLVIEGCPRGEQLAEQVGSILGDRGEKPQYFPQI